MDCSGRCLCCASDSLIFNWQLQLELLTLATLLHFRHLLPSKQAVYRSLGLQQPGMPLTTPCVYHHIYTGLS